MHFTHVLVGLVTCIFGFAVILSHSQVEYQCVTSPQESGQAMKKKKMYEQQRATSWAVQQRDKGIKFHWGRIDDTRRHAMGQHIKCFILTQFEHASQDDLWHVQQDVPPQAFLLRTNGMWHVLFFRICLKDQLLGTQLIPQLGKQDHELRNYGTCLSFSLSESERLRFNVENLAFQQEQAEITAMAASLAQIVGMVKFFNLAC